MNSLAVSFEMDYANRFHGIEIVHGNNPREVSVPYDNYAQAQNTAEHVGSLRSRLFSEIANDTEGIDVEAVDCYFRAIGLPRRDFIIITSKDLSIYNRITAQYGWPAYPSNDTDGNFYYGVCPAGTELAVVLRDKEAEDIYGTAFTEGHLVHELAHASSDWNEWTINKYAEGRILTTRRIGQTVINIGGGNILPRYGDFLEEGFAATIQAEYLRINGKEYNYENYADIAAAGLANLCAKSPDLFKAMIEARRSIEGLRKVAQLINKINPGLYSQLQKYPYIEAGFKQATRDIEELVS